MILVKYDLGLEEQARGTCFGPLLAIYGSFMAILAILAKFGYLAAFGGQYASFKPRITTAEHEWMKLDAIQHILANCGHLAWSLGPFMGYYGAMKLPLF